MNGCAYNEVSKEEIEKAKDFMAFYKNYCLNRETINIENYETVNDEEFVYKNIETILKYITQLESDKQKLIEKLEKYTNNTKKEKLPYFKTVADMIRYKGYAEGRIEACEKILSIVKEE